MAQQIQYQASKKLIHPCKLGHNSGIFNNPQSQVLHKPMQADSRAISTNTTE